MSRRWLVSALIAAALSAGCAQVRVKPLNAVDEKDRYRAEGVRFYRPWPYLLVTAETSKEGTTIKHTILYLPQMDQEFIATIEPGWGAVNGTVKLQDGWNLAELGAASDSKIPETITAVSGLITAVAGIESVAPQGVQVLPPGLYRFDFGKDGYVSGLTQINLPMQEVRRKQ